MEIEKKYLDIIKKIDTEVKTIFSFKKNDEANDMAILSIVPDHMTEFKIILDNFSQDEMDQICARYVGFFAFAEFLTRFAQATRDGAFNDILAMSKI